MKIYQHDAPFPLESGVSLPNLQLAYTTYGTRNADDSNVVWVFHALTANADPLDWWSGLVGLGQLIDPNRHFIICANMIGSPYGSTSPNSLNPETGKPFGSDFPLVSIRDMVRAYELLQKSLNIQKIALGIGGSMGGQQLLEWAIITPQLFEKIAVIACGAKQMPWAIALNEAQRMAIEADTEHKGKKGLQAARAMAMASYRSYDSYNLRQAENPETELLTGFRAASYQRHQGWKLEQRFDAWCYWSIIRSMDTHHVGRGRGNTKWALGKIAAKTLVIGIESDILFPPAEQAFIAAHIPEAEYHVIPSIFGHDGFLIEYQAMNQIIRHFSVERAFMPSNVTQSTEFDKQNTLIRQDVF